MKKEWLVTNVTAVGSPDRVDHAILKVILVGRFLLPIEAVIVGMESLCDEGTQS